MNIPASTQYARNFVTQAKARLKDSKPTPKFAETFEKFEASVSRLASYDGSSRDLDKKADGKVSAGTEFLHPTKDGFALEASTDRRGRHREQGSLVAGLFGCLVSSKPAYNTDTTLFQVNDKTGKVHVHHHTDSGRPTEWVMDTGLGTITQLENPPNLGTRRAEVRRNRV